jgi:hypothetical protein
MDSFGENQLASQNAATQANQSGPTLYRSPVVFCVFVLLYEVYAYNAVFLAQILPAEGKADQIPPFAAGFNLVWFVTFWTYLVVHCSDPGTITDQWRYFVESTKELDVIVSRQEWQPGKVTSNKRSNEVRPERAHFCSTTSRDVLRMDHFCPWTGNTVGFLNHKQFLQLGIYGALSGAVALGTSMPEIIGCVTAFNTLTPLGTLSLIVKIQFFLFAFFAAAVTTLLSGLFISHFPLACRNMTTIEELYINMPNPYDQQTWFRNLEQVFGRFGWDWFLPVKSRHPKSDGFSYPRLGEVLPEGLLEVYGRDAVRSEDDQGMSLNRKLPEDIWFFRYTGQDRAKVQGSSSSWLGNFTSFAWLSR